MEWTSHILLVSHKLEEAGVVLRSSPNEVHSVAISGAHLHLGTAIVKSFSILFCHKEVQGIDGLLVRGGCDGLGNVDEVTLLRGTCEGAEEGSEVVPASRA